MGTDLRLRAPRWEDFDDLRENYYLCYEEREQGYPIGITLFEERPSYAAEVEWFSGFLHRVLREEVVAVVAEREGHVVGNCSVGPRGPGPGSEVAHVGDLGILVHRDHRGSGVGSALLKEAIERCRGKFEVLTLDVFENNEGAKRLYRRFGFERCGRVPRAIRRRGTYFDEEKMVLILGPAGAGVSPGPLGAL
jgi:ribosomal protein S18 acetylase RimI-like enzyme